MNVKLVDIEKTNHGSIYDFVSDGGDHRIAIEVFEFECVISRENALLLRDALTKTLEG